MDSTSGVLKYIGHKARRVRWQPVEKGHYAQSTYFTTGSYDDKLNKVYLWEYNRQKSDDDIGSLNEPKEVSDVIVSADVTDLLYINSQFLCASLANGSVVLLRHTSKKTLQKSEEWEKLHFCGDQSLPCTTITNYSHSQGTVLTGGEDGRLTVLSLEQSQPVQIVEDKDSTSITSVLSYYHSEVLVANLSGQLKLWDLRVNPVSKPAKTFPVNCGEMVSVQCLDYHPNQPHLITAGCDNGTISFFDLRHEKIPISLIQGHSQEVWESRFHSSCPDNLLTCSQDGSLFHWASLNHYKTTIDDNNIWLSGAIAKGKVDIKQLLPETNSLSVNSFDVEKDCMLAVTDGEALYVIPNLDFH